MLASERPQADGGRAATAGGRSTAPRLGAESPTLGPRRSYATKRRSPARVAVLVIAGGIALVVALVLILSNSGGGSSTANSAHRTAAGGASGTAHARAHARHSTGGGSRPSAAAPAGAGATNVVVLNGTGTAGLAHRVAGELRQSGYSQATPMGGSPPGSNQVTLVEYASGHQGDAEGVARSLGVGQAQPMEASVASLSGSATVVVIVGPDKAATVP